MSNHTLTQSGAATLSEYQEMGYANRKAYLRGLAEDNGVDLMSVMALAAVLGPNEDFDGLVTAVEDLGGGL
jgi:hypothetical protein